MTPEKSGKKRSADGNQKDSGTPPEKPPCPRRVDNCKAADFGQPPKDLRRLAKPSDVQQKEDAVDAADMELEVLESDGEGPKIKKFTRAPHRRPKQKKKLSQSDIKLLVVKRMLCKVNVTLGNWYKMHRRRTWAKCMHVYNVFHDRLYHLCGVYRFVSWDVLLVNLRVLGMAALGFLVVPETLARHAPAKKATSCALGGYVALQRRLVAQCGGVEVQPIGCPACHYVLKEGGFEIATLDKFIQQALDQGHANIPELMGPSKQEDKTEDKTEDKKAEQMPEPSNPHEDVDPFRYVRQFYPAISLLPPGMGGKAFPFRCNVCKTRRQRGMGNTNILCGVHYLFAGCFGVRIETCCSDPMHGLSMSPCWRHAVPGQVAALVIWWKLRPAESSTIWTSISNATAMCSI